MVVILEGMPHGNSTLVMNRLVQINHVRNGYVCLKDRGEARNKFEREERAMALTKVGMNESQCTLDHKLRLICNFEVNHDVG